MKNEELYLALETLNKEKKDILCGTEYKTGLRITTIKKILRGFNVKKALQIIRLKKAQKKIQKKYNSFEFRESVANIIDYTKKRIAIYTCIIGDYDNINVPLVKFDNADYYLLTDNKEKYRKFSKVFQIIELDKDLLSKGAIIANRFAKFHPKHFFGKYDFALYLDGSVRIVSNILKNIQFISKTTGIAMYNHRERNDIYQEAEVCKLLKRGNLAKINLQMERYKKEGFPQNYGMNEATIIFSDLNNKESIYLLDEWYKEFVYSNSLRDQLAWPYVLWKNNYSIKDVGCLGSNIYEDYSIEINKHT